MFPYALEAAATGRSPVTPALENAALARILMVVPHEDFHNQPEMRNAPPEAAEAAATLVGFLTAAAFARERFGPDAPVSQQLHDEARLFSEKSAVVNGYYDEVAALYASYDAGETPREMALTRKREVFERLREACAAIEPAPASFTRCPAVLNNAGLAFDRTYTREYPALFDLETSLGVDLGSTVARFRRLIARWPGGTPDRADLMRALETVP